MFGDKEDSVWNRSGSDSISARGYNLVIGLTLLWGFVANFLMLITIPTSVIASIPAWLLLVGYFVCCLVGIAMFTHSDNPAISFLGYNLVVIPFGLIINLLVSSFAPGIVLNAVIITGLVTALMMTLSSLFPKFFENIGPALFISLLCVILIELFMIIFVGHSATWIDWIVALIFCGYIGFDWYRANSIPKTLNNAIDSAASLYMDIINLFVRILSILGKK